MSDETPGALIRRVTGTPDGEKLNAEVIGFLDGISRTKAQKAQGYGRAARLVEVKGPQTTVGVCETGELRIITWTADDGEHEEAFRAAPGQKWRRVMLET